MATLRYRIYLEMSYLRNYQISTFPIIPAKELDDNIFFLRGTTLF